MPNDWAAKHPEKRKEWQRQFCLRHPEKVRGWQHWSYIKRRYGLTQDQYEELLEQQDGKCAICRGEGCASYEHFSVDHDHKTGEVRGLLCRRCNLLVGYANDDPELITRAAEYLRMEVA